MIERVVLRGQRPRLGLVLAMIAFIAVWVASAVGLIAKTIVDSTSDERLPWLVTGAFVLVAAWLVCEVAKMMGLLRIATVFFQPDGYRVTTPFLPGSRHRSAPRRGEPTALSVAMSEGEGDGLVRHRFTLAQASSTATFGAFVPLTSASVEALAHAFARHATPLAIDPSVLAAPADQGKATSGSAVEQVDQVLTMWVAPGSPASLEIATPALTLEYEPVPLRVVDIRHPLRVIFAASEPVRGVDVCLGGGEVPQVDFHTLTVDSGHRDFATEAEEHTGD